MLDTIKEEVEHESKDCNICFWGCKTNRTHYKDGKPANSEIVFTCSQDGRPKPCQRALRWKIQ